MNKSEAITEHLKHWSRFPVFVWMENNSLTTQVDGKVYRATNMFGLDSMLSDGGVPAPRNLYFVDEPAYEGQHE
jgi:hypothetical protein